MNGNINRPACRLAVLQKHIHTNKRLCSGQTLRSDNATSPTITVSPRCGMVDDIVRIQLKGFQRREHVTLVASLIENGVQFSSRCVYRTDDEGCADNFSCDSSAGTFQGIEPMGLFWSLKSDPLTRLIKKDVTSPMTVNIQVFPGTQTENNLPREPVTDIHVQRLFMRPGVKRVALPGKLQGTVFIPDGKGPFPALIDLHGGIVSLIETRAALLASHGYVAMSLSYLYGPDLPQDLKDTSLNYLLEAYQWLSEQEYVDKKRLGAVGLCYGGSICLKLTSVLPQIRAVVNVNGIPFSPNPVFPGFCTEAGDPWPDKDKVFHTDEGFDLTDTYDCENPIYHPAWQHGAKVLIIVGEDDKQVHPKWHSYFYEKCPDEYKSNIQVYHYTGAGHMIEQPYTPHIRSTVPGKKRLQAIYFVPEKYHDLPMMAGGWTATHAHAQEDSWKKILDFLENNLKNLLLR